MAEPIELIRGSERQTVYSDIKARPLEAEGWQRVKNLTPEQQARLADLPPMPFAGYEDMRVEEVIEKAQGLPPARIQEIVTYESATKGRKSLIDKLTGRTSEKGTWATDKSEPAEQPLVTVETVVEKPLETTETVEIKPANDVPAAMGQGRLAGKGGSAKGSKSE